MFVGVLARDTLYAIARRQHRVKFPVIAASALKNECCAPLPSINANRAIIITAQQPLTQRSPRFSHQMNILKQEPGWVFDQHTLY